MYKVNHGLSPLLVSELFEPRNDPPYNLRHFEKFKRPTVNTVYHGTESISVLGPKIWEILPEDLKASPSLMAFKRAVKKWKPENCPCRLCKVFIQNIGFL